MGDDDGDAAAPADRQDRLGQRRVALGVEVGVGLVEDDEERVAIERAGQRDALALAGGERGAALADLRRVAVGEVKDEVMDARRLRRLDDLLRLRVRVETGDVLGDRAGEELDVLRQVADVLAERCRDAIAPAPRRRGGRGRGPAAQAPMMTRTSEDLPAPLGPMTPRALPAFRVKLTSTTDGRFEAGGTTARFSTLSAAFGAGSGIGSSVSGNWASRRLRRRQAWRLATKPFQLATSISTGCSARAPRIEAAMITPNEAWLTMTRYAPSPSRNDWNIMRKTLLMPE